MADEPKVFDLEDALRRVGGDRSLYRELLDLFSAEFPAGLARLKQAIEAGNLKEIQESAHSMKSALGNLSAMRAYTMAQRIEAAGRQARPAGLDEEVRRLEDEVNQYQKAARAVFGSAS